MTTEETTPPPEQPETTAAAPAEPTPAVAVAPIAGGTWQCQNSRCNATWDGPKQADVKETLICPNCGGDVILYLGDKQVAKEA